MKPKKEIVEPKAEISFGPFSEPRTIPGGWDVSSFYSPEQVDPVLPEAPASFDSVNENSEDTLS